MRFAIAYWIASLGLILPLHAATNNPMGACGGASLAEPTAQLVLGHFSGGRIFRTSDGVPMIAWRDEFQCFTSRQVCHVWQRRMDAAYRNVEGYRTCLPIR